MGRVQVEDSAGVAGVGPGEPGLLVAFDEPHRAVERAALVGVGKEEKSLPVVRAEGSLILGDRSAVGDGPVAGEDAPGEEVRCVGIDGELEVSVQEASRDAFGHRVHAAQCGERIHGDEPVGPGGVQAGVDVVHDHPFSGPRSHDHPSGYST